MKKTVNSIITQNSRIIKKNNPINVAEENVIISGNLLINNDITKIENEDYLQAENEFLADNDNPNTNDEPTIIIDKENGKIKKITVMCSCGRHAELECEYSENEEEETAL